MSFQFLFFSFVGDCQLSKNRVARCWRQLQEEKVSVVGCKYSLYYHNSSICGNPCLLQKSSAILEPLPPKVNNPEKDTCFSNMFLFSFLDCSTLLNPQRPKQSNKLNFNLWLWRTGMCEKKKLWKHFLKTLISCLRWSMHFHLRTPVRNQQL